MMKYIPAVPDARATEAALLAQAELPPLTEAMTAADLARHRTAMLAQLAHYGDAHVTIEAHNGVKGNARVYISYGTAYQFFDAPTWGEAITRAQAWLTAQSRVRRENLIRSMALALIDLTDQHGRVTPRLLRAQGFDDATITELGPLACARANEMCAGVPFTIEQE